MATDSTGYITSLAASASAEHAYSQEISELAVTIPIIRALGCGKPYLELARSYDDDKYAKYFLDLETSQCNHLDYLERLRLEASNNVDVAMMRDQALRALKCCKEQWELADSIVKDLASQAKRFPYTPTITNVCLWEHDVFITTAYIDLLADLIKSKRLHDTPDFEKGFFLLLNKWSEFKMEGATTLDIRSNDAHTKWKEELKRRYKVHEKNPISGTVSSHETTDNESAKDLSGENLLTTAPSEGEALGKSTVEMMTATLEDGSVKAMGWCPVLKGFISADKGSAAHIVPHKIGFEIAKMLFENHEKGEDILWDIRNGLWMAKVLEKHFDKGNLVIVPAEDQTSNDSDEGFDLRVVVLNETLLKKGNTIYKVEEPDFKKTYNWIDVDNTILDFRGVTARPSKSYLLFSFLHTTLRIITQKPKGWEYSVSKIADIGRSWASSRTLLIQGILENFQKEIERVGRISAQTNADSDSDSSAEEGNNEEIRALLAPSIFDHVYNPPPMPPTPPGQQEPFVAYFVSEEDVEKERVEKLEERLSTMAQSQEWAQAFVNDFNESVNENTAAWKALRDEMYSQPSTGFAQEHQGKGDSISSSGFHQPAFDDEEYMEEPIFGEPEE